MIRIVAGLSSKAGLSTLAAAVSGLATLVVPLVVQAEGLRNPPPGAYAMSRGVARVARVDDATAIFLNPANLLDLDSKSVAFTPSVVDIEREVEADWGGEATTIDNLKLLGGFFAAFPGESDRFAWGIGVSVPYGQSVVYEKDFDFKYLTPHFTELMVISLSPSVAYRISDSISVGASLDLMWTRLKLHQRYPWKAITQDPASPDGAMKFSGEDTVIGGILALNWDLNENHRISLTWRPSFEAAYDGDFTINNLPLFAPALGVTEKSDFKTDIEYPDIWKLGYGVHLSEKWSLALAAEHVGWSSVDALELDVDNNAVLFPSTTLPLHWEDTWTWGVSGDYRASDLWTFSGSYWDIETPIPEYTMSPNLMESDIGLWSLGAKRQLGRHALDFSYTLMLYDKRTVTENLQPAYLGEYDTTASIYQLTWSYAFQ